MGAERSWRVTAFRGPGRRRRGAFVLSILAAALVAGAVAGSTAEPTSLQGPEQPVPRTYFGMHIHRAATKTAWPAVPFGRWRLWDAYVAWPHVEPRPGEWRFDTLDRYVTLADRARVELLLPLGLSPSWASARPAEPSAYRQGNAAEPRDIGAWRRYVQTVATRYKGRVAGYEIWNEPNLKSFYTGGVEAMVDLAREAFVAIKAIDPAAIVVSPSPTEGSSGLAWLDAFLRGGGAAYADVIGYHFYVAPGTPEAMVDLVHRVQAVMRRHGVDKPLWNTESGWPIESRQRAVEPRGGQGLYSRVLSDREAAGYVARAHVLGWVTGVSAFYWYAWDNYVMGVVEADGRTPKTVAAAYAEVQRWLVGARIESCARDAAGTWICGRATATTRSSWIAWSERDEARLRPPSAWGRVSVRGLLGGSEVVDGAEPVAVGPLPVLIEPLGALGRAAAE